MFFLFVTLMTVLACSAESAAVVEDSLLAGETADAEGSFFGLSGELTKVNEIPGQNHKSFYCYPGHRYFILVGNSAILKTCQSLM